MDPGPQGKGDLLNMPRRIDSHSGFPYDGGKFATGGNDMAKMRDGLRLRGKVYWIKYYRDGKAYEESVDKALGRRGCSYQDAKRLLKSRQGSIADGRFFGLSAEKTEFGGFRE